MAISRASVTRRRACFCSLKAFDVALTLSRKFINRLNEQGHARSLVAQGRDMPWGWFLGMVRAMALAPALAARDGIGTSFQRPRFGN